MYDKQAVCRILRRMEQAVAAKAEYLGELDGLSGDGDLGMSMQAAFSACAQAAEAADGADLGRLLMQAGMACNKAAPSTMGPLLSCGILALGKACKGKSALTDAEVIAFPRIFADAIAARGRAKRGDKTILDALYPLAEAVEGAAGTLAEVFSAGAAAAEQAAADTAGIVAKAGRAKWIGERAAQYPDGGASMCAIAVRGAVTA